jgi:hypothetical protein
MIYATAVERSRITCSLAEAMTSPAPEVPFMKVAAAYVGVLNLNLM